MRLAFGIEYLGTNYRGWQKQSLCHNTVQTILERALSKVADSPVACVCAGRTDAGVHAIQQVVHIDLNVERPVTAWLFGVNAYLPKDIKIKWVKEVDDTFHARFSAKTRRYVYKIDNTPISSAIFHQHAAWEPRPLNVAAMQQAARFFLGEHDFSSLRAAECQARHPVRTVLHSEIGQEGQSIVFFVEANAFLHHMVRNMVGVLMAVGHGKYPPEAVVRILQAKNRSAAGVTAEAHGLYFVGPTYEEKYEIPALHYAPGYR